MDLSGSDKANKNQHFDDCEDIGDDDQPAIDLGQQLKSTGVQKKNVFDDYKGHPYFEKPEVYKAQQPMVPEFQVRPELISKYPTVIEE